MTDGSGDGVDTYPVGSSTARFCFGQSQPEFAASGGHLRGRAYHAGAWGGGVSVALVRS